MLYRKAPPTPPRLLLRIVATAGAGALLGFTGCSSSSTVDGIVVNPEAGSVPNVPSDASDDGSSPCGVVFCGIVANPSDAEAEFDVTSHPPGLVPYNPDAAGPCGGGSCGTVAIPPDAGDAGHASDASDHDASPPDDAAIGPCHPCGVVIRPDE